MTPVVEQVGDHEDEGEDLLVVVETFRQEPDVPQRVGHGGDRLGDLVEVVGHRDRPQRRLDRPQKPDISSLSSLSSSSSLSST